MCGRVSVLRERGEDIMVLSGSQYLMLTVCLALCACFLLPRLFGGGGGGVRDGGKRDPRRMPPHLHGSSHRDSSHGRNPVHGGGSEKSSNLDQIKGAMEQELKNENMGSGRSMAFTLMPIYAVGVAIFAAYKFTKIRSKENSKSSNEKDKKALETENELLALEQHLSRTEHMLNALLTQLDPLSDCVNTMATDQKDEIMSQLQSIRQLMKKSGMDKVSLRNSGKQTCEDTLEGLIHSFEYQNSNCEKQVENESEESVSDTEKTGLTGQDSVTEKSAVEVSPCEEGAGLFEEADVTSRHLSDGLRKRTVKD